MSSQDSTKKPTVPVRVMAECERDLIAAFPGVDEAWFGVLLERLKDNAFTAEEVRIAVNTVIDTCHYPRPAIADIIAARPKKQEKRTFITTESLPAPLPKEERARIAERISEITAQLKKDSDLKPMTKEELEKRKREASESLREDGGF